MAEYDIVEISGVITKKEKPGFLSAAMDKNHFYILVKNVTTGQELEKSPIYWQKYPDISPGANEKAEEILDKLFAQGWELIEKRENMPNGHYYGGGSKVRLRRAKNTGTNAQASSSTKTEDFSGTYPADGGHLPFDD